MGTSPAHNRYEVVRMLFERPDTDPGPRARLRPTGRTTSIGKMKVLSSGLHVAVLGRPE